MDVITTEKPGVAGKANMKSKSAQHKAHGWSRLWQLAWLRRVVQLYFVLFIAKLVVEQAFVGENSTTLVPSAEAYCPFGGVESLYRFVTSLGQTAPHTHWSNLVLFVSVLLVTLVTKSAFCSWICPFGTLQEWLGALGRRFGLRKSVPPSIDRALRYLKYLVLIWATAGAAMTGTLVFRDWDPYHALIGIAEVGFAASTVVLVATMVASVFVERPWCKYACPLGAIIGLLGHLSLVKVERVQSLCANCSLCDKRCPMGVNVSTADRIGTAECHNCLTCVEACPKAALEPKFISLSYLARGGKQSEA